MLYKNLAMALVIGISSQASYASVEKSSFCDTCVTDQQYMTHARSLIKKDGSIVTHIFNISKFDYKKYSTSRKSSIECEYDQEPDGRGGKLQICRNQYDYTTTELTIPSQDLSDFTDYAIAYNDAPSQAPIGKREKPGKSISPLTLSNNSLIRRDNSIILTPLYIYRMLGYEQF